MSRKAKTTDLPTEGRGAALDSTETASERYRTSSTDLLYPYVGSLPQITVLTSAGPEEGKSTTCASLGVALARAGKSTLLVDCDFRDPALHTFFGLSNATGTSSVLAEKSELQEVWGEPLPGLKVVPAGPTPPLGSVALLSPAHLSGFFASVREEFDCVLVNAPSMESVLDPLDVATEADGAFLVLDAQKGGSKRDAQEAAYRLEWFGANALGALMSDVIEELLPEQGTLTDRQEPHRELAQNRHKKTRRVPLRGSVPGLRTLRANVLGMLGAVANKIEVGLPRGVPPPEQRAPTDRQEGAREGPQDAKKKKNKGLVEFLVMLVVAFALLFGVIKPFIVEAFYIPSESMVPTLEVGDRVLANEFIYRFREPERGDIVVFRSPEFGGVDLIKRVVGLPGDKIEVKSGALYVNGEYQEEPYLNPALPDESSYGPMVVPPGYIFAMGDNRADSADSRFFGPVPYDHIVGEAFLRVWPLNELGSV